MRTKYINEISEIEEIINKSDICFLSMSDKNQPYVIPMNFAYENRIIYMHTAMGGKKMDILKENNKVCVAFSIEHELAWQNENVACSYSMRSRSVVAYGEVEFIDDENTKMEYMNRVMKKYTKRDDFSYSKPSIDNVCVFIINVSEISGKKLGGF